MARSDGTAASQGLKGVRKAARERKQERFTRLPHHLTVDLPRDSFHALKRDAAPGVDAREMGRIRRRTGTTAVIWPPELCGVPAHRFIDSTILARWTPHNMRQSRSYGSVRGVRGNSHPYRDIALSWSVAKPKLVDRPQKAMACPTSAGNYNRVCA
jgi:hypothetical protein